MRIGVSVSSTGIQSEPSLLLECAKAAERAGFSDIWMQERIAIAPEDAESGSGRCLDPLTALAWLAGQTNQIGLGMSALILPYRPPLLTAKTVATLQDLSGNRLSLGVGVGWMESEFRALGVPRSERGRRTDESLAFLKQSFEKDIMESHGQRFLFLPRPKRPPIYVGGAGDHALKRTVRFADGWMPMFQFWRNRPDTISPEELAPQIARLHEMAQEEGRSDAPEVILGVAFDPDEPQKASDQMQMIRNAGVNGLVTGSHFEDLSGFLRILEFLEEHVVSPTREPHRIQS